METMWAPWRIEYILGEKEGECIFCAALGEKDDLTLVKGPDVMVVMNKFPYINGHLLVAPVQHVSSLDNLSEYHMGRLLSMIDASVGILKTVMKPDGFNIGLNLGRAAGAGVEEHLHFHIVPRWYGDTNSLTVFGEIRVIPEHLKQTYEKLKPHFKTLTMPPKR
ncbi:MAG: HIT domain-containing protein [Desulfobacterales bacterium]